MQHLNMPAGLASLRICWPSVLAGSYPFYLYSFFGVSGSLLLFFQRTGALSKRKAFKDGREKNQEADISRRFIRPFSESLL
jgi:hypothetical protein